METMQWDELRFSSSGSAVEEILKFQSDQEVKTACSTILKLVATVCSTFSRSGWSVVRSAWLAKGGTSKKRQSPHLHKVPTRSNKASPRTFQTALVHWMLFLRGFPSPPIIFFGRPYRTSWQFMLIIVTVKAGPPFYLDCQLSLVPFASIWVLSSYISSSCKELPIPV
jgi:hypothetical protein